jgi:glycosyltransferase involved in cell wall biosynthesis
MVEKKGFSYFIQAARILKDRGVKFSAKIAGDAGTEKTNLVNLTKELGLESYITFTNEVPFSEHSHNYLESDIFVMPSIKPKDGNLDGIPNVIVEAMLAGLPVIATNVSAIPELIEDGKTGFLINQKDEKMLADRLETLLRDRSKREEFGKAGRSKVLKMFNTINLVEDALSAN